MAEIKACAYVLNFLGRGTPMSFTADCLELHDGTKLEC